MVYKIEFISATSALELSAQIRANWVKCDEVIDSNELVIEATDLQVYLAARVKEKQVGLLNLKFPYSANAHIGWLGVLLDYQGQGARTSLIHAAYVYAKQQRVQTMTVAVVTPDKENNDYLKSYQFYEKHGFQPLLNGSSEAGMVYMLKPLYAFGQIHLAQKLKFSKLSSLKRGAGNEIKRRLLGTSIYWL